MKSALEKIFSWRRRRDRVPLKVMLEKFREVLDGNNRALELIADIGDKLSGDYLFDMQYIRSICEELDGVVYRIVYNLNMLSNKRYMRLFDAFERAKTAVRQELEPRGSSRGTRYLVPIAQAGIDLADEVGEKMAVLGELRRRFGFRVPDGFCLSADAYAYFMEYNRLERKIKPLLEEWNSPDGRPLEDISREIEGLIMDAKVPPDLFKAVENAASSLEKTAKGGLRFAVRSSASGEDSQTSYAGLFRSLLNVPASRLMKAYKEVLASLFCPAVISYRERHDRAGQEPFMAVGFMMMVPSAASGVIYSLNPASPEKESILVSASLGLGKTVVEATGPVDQFELSRDPPHRVIERKIAKKQKRCIPLPEGDVGFVDLAPGEGDSPSVSEEVLARLAAIAIQIETYMKSLQDIEWALDPGGEIFILQARPLRISAEAKALRADLTETLKRYPVLLKDRGVIACRGIGAGRVFYVESEQQLDSFPQGGVLLLRHTSPRMSRFVSKASAIITDIGSATGHLATIAREFRVPMIVDTVTATRIIEPGTEVTVDAEENIVYKGIIKELIKYQLLQEVRYEDTPEFRLLRRLARKVSHLNLTDPEQEGFSPENCITYHDIIRFAHEMAVREISEAIDPRHHRGDYPSRKLRLSIPLDLVLIDIGCGLKPGIQKGFADPEDVNCEPLGRLIDGLTEPGVWHVDPVEMDFKGFMSGFLKASSFTVPGANRIAQNIAIISREYLNLNLRLGYHFNMVDSYLSDNMNDNYIYFRFLGGAADPPRRSRRARLLQRILEANDFLVKVQGDLVVARSRKESREDTSRKLRMIGRLIGFTRQLDIMLRTEGSVEEFASRFLNGRYSIQ